MTTRVLKGDEIDLSCAFEVTLNVVSSIVIHLKHCLMSPILQYLSGPQILGQTSFEGVQVDCLEPHLKLQKQHNNKVSTDPM